jgi:hypothetical protein
MGTVLRKAPPHVAARRYPPESRARAWTEGAVSRHRSTASFPRDPPSNRRRHCRTPRRPGPSSRPRAHRRTVPRGRDSSGSGWSRPKKRTRLRQMSRRRHTQLPISPPVDVQPSPPLSERYAPCRAASAVAMKDPTRNDGLILALSRGCSVARIPRREDSAGGKESQLTLAEAVVMGGPEARASRHATRRAQADAESNKAASPKDPRISGEGPFYER